MTIEIQLSTLHVLNVLHVLHVLQMTSNVFEHLRIVALVAQDVCVDVRSEVCDAVRVAYQGCSGFEPLHTRYWKCRKAINIWQIKICQSQQKTIWEIHRLSAPYPSYPSSKVKFFSLQSWLGALVAGHHERADTSTSIGTRPSILRRIQDMFVVFCSGELLSLTWLSFIKLHYRSVSFDSSYSISSKPPEASIQAIRTIRSKVAELNGSFWQVPPL